MEKYIIVDRDLVLKRSPENPHNLSDESILGWVIAASTEEARELAMQIYPNLIHMVYPYSHIAILQRDREIADFKTLKQTLNT